MSILKKRIDSFRFAFKGLADLFISQPNARIHGIVAVIALILGGILGLSKIEWCLIILSIFAVLSAEAFNTALEYLTDLVSPEYHILAGKTKDVAAAGVLLTAIGAFIIGVVIYAPKILLYLNIDI